ncbi:unnamed protein product [Euphydryas editha]|uniref:Uncharacterized protein n=1 Tax=Euphydryas editha TaxID=104508 RepID=A0AAU9V1A7_EUPED|nr:unnamed protein product [Euphydryas editha]
MDKKLYMNRAKRLVCLSLRNDCDNGLGTTEMKSVLAAGNQAKDFIQPDDLGLSSIPPQSSFLDHVEDEIFEDYGHKIFLNPNVAVPVFDLNEDIYYIENSQDFDYTELNCNSKRLKLDTSNESLNENLSRNYVLNKPKVTVPETPCNSESESESDYMKSDTISAILNNDADSVFPDPPVIHNSQPKTTPTTSSLKVYNKKQRKEVLKFPNYSKEEKILKSREKHLMLPDNCGLKCRKKCEYFNFQRRSEIWNSYWNLNHDSQIKWIARYVHLKPVMIKRMEKEGEKFRKNESRSYFLPCHEGEMKQVCKKMFLNTFGYKNDSIITTVSKKLKQDTTKSLADKRGTHDKPKIDTSFIEHFINLYKPCVAHYRRHNSPNMRYLGQDVTLETLFKEFKEQYPEFKCSKEIIRRTLKWMNISLNRPKSDKCYDCLSYETTTAGYLTENQVPSLKFLCQKTVHNQKAKEAMGAYSNDASRNKILGEKYTRWICKSQFLYQ